MSIATSSMHKGRHVTATSTGMRGLRASMVCAFSSNLVDGASLYDEKNSALKDGWMRSIEAAPETAVELEL